VWGEGDGRAGVYLAFGRGEFAELGLVHLVVCEEGEDLEEVASRMGVDVQMLRHQLTDGAGQVHRHRLHI
jgi:hypothetical protein